MDDRGIALRARFAEAVDDLQAPTDLANAVRVGARGRRRRQRALQATAAAVVIGVTAFSLQLLPHFKHKDTGTSLSFAAPADTDRAASTFTWRSTSALDLTKFDPLAIVRDYFLFGLPQNLRPQGEVERMKTSELLTPGGKNTGVCQFFADRAGGADDNYRTARFCIEQPAAGDDAELETLVRRTIHPSKAETIRRGTINGRLALAVVPGSLTDDYDSDSSRWTALYFRPGAPLRPDPGHPDQVIVITGTALTKIDFSDFVFGLHSLPVANGATGGVGPPPPPVATGAPTPSR